MIFSKKKLGWNVDYSWYHNMKVIEIDIWCMFINFIFQSQLYFPYYKKKCLKPSNSYNTVQLSLVTEITEAKLCMPTNYHDWQNKSHTSPLKEISKLSNKSIMNSGNVQIKHFLFPPNSCQFYMVLFSYFTYSMYHRR